MFSILPLQLATNLFVAERPEDLNRFYGLDTLDATKQLERERAIEEASPIVPNSAISQGLNDVTGLEIEKLGSKYVIRDPPRAKNIIIYESIDEVEPTKPGDLCIVPNGGQPLAWYHCEDDDEDFE